MGHGNLPIDDIDDINEEPWRIPDRSISKGSAMNSSLIAAAIPILPSAILNSNEPSTTNQSSTDERKATTTNSMEPLDEDDRIAITRTSNSSSTTGAGSGPRQRPEQHLNFSSVDTSAEPQMIRYLGSSMQVRSEQKATKVLGVVFFTFVICWSPFFILNLIDGLLEREILTAWVSNQMMTTFQWLGYISSTINPVIYTVFNRNFRRAFRHLLLCKGPNQRYSEINKSFRFSQYGGAGGPGGHRNPNQLNNNMNNINSTSMCATQLMSSNNTPSRANYHKSHQLHKEALVEEMGGGRRICDSNSKELLFPSQLECASSTATATAVAAAAVDADADEGAQSGSGNGVPSNPERQREPAYLNLAPEHTNEQAIGRESSADNQSPSGPGESIREEEEEQGEGEDQERRSLIQQAAAGGPSAAKVKNQFVRKTNNLPEEPPGRLLPRKPTTKQTSHKQTANGYVPETVKSALRTGLFTSFSASISSPLVRVDKLNQINVAEREKLEPRGNGISPACQPTVELTLVD